MLITFKTLQQQTFKVEIDGSETVLALKQKVEETKGSEYAAAGQKLIYAGKILDDAKTVGSYDIQEKNFVVIMVTKAKASSSKPAESSPVTTATPSAATVTTTTTTSAPSAPTTVATPAATATTPAAASTAATPAETTDSKKEDAPKAPSSESASATSNTGSASTTSGLSVAESTLVTGDNLETVISEMMSLGFTRDLVERALVSSFNNPDRAVEYLLSGSIPEVMDPEPPREAVQQGATTTPSGQEGQAPPSGEDSLEFLASSPQFQQMRRMVQQNPSMLHQLLEQLGQQNPQLLQLIRNNQERFIHLLNQPVETSAGGGQAPEVEGQAGGQGQGVSYIQVTPEEKLAIERLKALGFPENQVIQAYFACEKNENLAANLLLQGLDD